MIFEKIGPFRDRWSDTYEIVPNQKNFMKFFLKITFLKSGNYTEKNELSHAFIASFIKKSVFYHVASRSLEGIVES